MQRINVIGASGSGKTTFARQIAARRGLPYVELDALHHLPDWQERPIEEFRSEVASRVAGDAWVIDGNYTKVRDIVWSRVQTVIFLDLPRWRTMAQLVPRTLRRVVTRQELWNGNRERWANLVATVPEENILLWSWTTHQKQRDRFAAAMNEARWAHIEFLRLESRRDIRRLLESAAATQTR